MPTRTLAVAAAIALCAPSLALASERKGHPLIKLYEGSTISDQEDLAYAEESFPVGQTKDGEAKVEKVAGKSTVMQVDDPKDRSGLEKLRNYQSALKRAGFELVFECGDECPQYTMPTFGNIWNAHFATARLKRAEGDVWVAVKADNYVSTIEVLEAKPMEMDKVTVDAAAMKKGLESDGHVAVYGIVFDTNKADLKPESDPILAEIAKLLKNGPALKLHVVGHTDNVGDLAKNMDLSKRRADAVVKALTAKYGIAAARLRADGVGPLCAVATNRNDAGRAKNRRVDLVEQ